MFSIDETCTRKGMVALYKGRKLSRQAIEDSSIASFGAAPGEVELHWEKLSSFTGDVTTFFGTVYVDDELTITGIAPLHCERLLGDDARASGYKSIRAGDSEYFSFDLQLEDLLVEKPE